MGGAVALIEGAIASGGMMPQPERTLFAQVVGQQNMLTGDTFSLADPSLTAVFKQVYNTPTYRKLLATETQILASPPNRPMPVEKRGLPARRPGDPEERAGERDEGRRAAVRAVDAPARQRDDRPHPGRRSRPGRGGRLHLRHGAVGHRLRVELSDLYKSARRMADERLPRVVERLRRGNDVDVEAESPPLTVGRIAETSGRRAGLLHRAAHRRGGRRRPGQPAQGHQPGLRQPVTAEPVAAAPAAQHARHHGAGHRPRPGHCLADPVPA